MCLVPSCTPCSPMTTWPRSTPTPSSSLPATMSQPTGRWSVTWQCGARVTTSPSTSVRTKEMIVDYRKRGSDHASIHIDGPAVEQVESFTFLGGQITKGLNWSKHTQTVMKKVQKHLFPLRRLKKFGMGPQIRKKVYSCTTESILGPSSLPSRTSISRDVVTRPGKSLKAPTTNHLHSK